jgi:hypothetical protein
MTEFATIFVRFTCPGFHNWTGAPEHRAYLADKHRHLFHVEVRMKVAHDDREVEFHDVRDEAHSMFVCLSEGGDATPDFQSRSCEMLARELGRQLAELYRRPVTVIVSEDGEFGAQIEATF